jgi:multisubunit Na+/H+ antiporter MnhE subunit
MMRDAGLTEWVAAVLATMAVTAIVWLSLDGDQSARTALTGLVGAASSYFLTPKLSKRPNGGNTSTPPPTP